MAYANFKAPEPGFGNNPLLTALTARRQQETQKEIASKQIGADLQMKQAQIDRDLEIAKLNNATSKRIAQMRAGFETQWKQMGIDADILIQKLRNMNNMEVRDFERNTALMLERMKDEHVQAQIVKQFQTNLRLHNYDARQALLRTFNDTMGDIFKHGDPLSNAADSAAYGLWAIALLNAWNGLDLHRTVDADAKDVELGDPTKLVDYEGERNETNKAAEEIIKLLKEKGAVKPPYGQQNKGHERHAKPGFKTRIQQFYNERAGQPHIYKR